MDIGLERAFQFLNLGELIEVISLPKEQARRLAIGVSASQDMRALTLLLGDFSSAIVPFDRLKSNPKASPDFTACAVVDYGHAVRLGKYEASVRSLLA